MSSRKSDRNNNDDNDHTDMTRTERERLKNMYTQAKNDYNRLSNNYDTKQTESLLELSGVVNDYKDDYVGFENTNTNSSHGNGNTFNAQLLSQAMQATSNTYNNDNGSSRPSTMQSSKRSGSRPGTHNSMGGGGQNHLSSWVESTPVKESVIPHYDAISDPHCTYKYSRNMLQSPYMQQKRDATSAQKFFGIGTSSGGGFETAISAQDEILLTLVENRERTLRKLKQVFYDDNIESEECKRLIKEIRDKTVLVTEGIVEWRQRSSTSAVAMLPPLRSSTMGSSSSTGGSNNKPSQSYIWRGKNYMMKMLTDLEFINRIPAIMVLLPLNCRTWRNPFLLSYGIDEINSVQLLEEENHDLLIEEISIGKVIWFYNLFLEETVTASNTEKEMIMQQNTRAQEYLKKSTSTGGSSSNLESAEAAYGVSMTDTSPLRPRKTSQQRSALEPPDIHVKELIKIKRGKKISETAIIILACVKAVVYQQEPSKKREKFLHQTNLRKILNDPDVYVDQLKKFVPGIILPKALSIKVRDTLDGKLKILPNEMSTLPPWILRLHQWLNLLKIGRAVESPSKKNKKASPDNDNKKKSDALGEFSPWGMNDFDDEPEQIVPESPVLSRAGSPNPTNTNTRSPTNTNTRSDNGTADNSLNNSAIKNSDDEKSVNSITGSPKIGMNRTKRKTKKTELHKKIPKNNVTAAGALSPSKDTMPLNLDDNDMQGGGGEDTFTNNDTHTATMSSRESQFGGSIHPRSPVSNQFIPKFTLPKNVPLDHLAVIRQLGEELGRLKEELHYRGILEHGKENGIQNPLLKKQLETMPDGKSPAEENAQDTLIKMTQKTMPSNMDVVEGKPKTFGIRFLLFQESLSIDNMPDMHIRIWSMDGDLLQIQAKDIKSGRQLPAVVISTIFVDKLVGHTPTQLEDMKDELRRRRLWPLLKVLLLDEDDNICLGMDMKIHEGVHVISRRRMNVVVERMTFKNGVHVTARGISTEDPTDKFTLTVLDHELEILLCHHPGMFNRANTKWTVQQTVAEWIVARLSLPAHINASDNLNTSGSLILERSVPIPPEYMLGGIGKIFYCMEAKQDHKDLVITVRTLKNLNVFKDLDFHPANIDAHEAKAKLFDNAITQVSIERIPLVEMKSFIGAAGYLAEKQQHGVSLQEKMNLEKHMENANGLQRILERITVQIVDNKILINMDRIIFEDFVNITGVSVNLQSRVLKRDILFSARRISMDVNTETDDLFEKQLSEEECGRILAGEPYELRRNIVKDVNRVLLSRIVSTKMKFVFQDDNLKLETPLFMASNRLNVFVQRTDMTQMLVGSLRIGERTNLSMLRDTIDKEFDEDQCPDTYRFEYEGAPCSKKQEKKMLAQACVPKILLIPKPGIAGFAGFHGAQVETKKTIKVKKSRKSSNSYDSDDSINSEDQNLSKTKKRKSKKDTLVKTKKKDGSDESDKEDKKEEKKKSLATKLKSFKKQTLNMRKTKNGGDGGKKSMKSTIIKIEGESDSTDYGLSTESEDNFDKPIDKDEKALVPINTMLSVKHGEFEVNTNEDLSMILRRGYLLRLREKTGNDYRITLDSKKVFNSMIFTLTTPYIDPLAPEDDKEGLKVLDILQEDSINQDDEGKYMMKNLQILDQDQDLLIAKLEDLSVQSEAIKLDPKIHLTRRQAVMNREKLEELVKKGAQLIITEDDTDGDLESDEIIKHLNSLQNQNKSGSKTDSESKKAGNEADKEGEQIGEEEKLANIEISGGLEQKISALNSKEEDPGKKLADENAAKNDVLSGYEAMVGESPTKKKGVGFAVADDEEDTKPKKKGVGFSVGFADDEKEDSTPTNGTESEAKETTVSEPNEHTATVVKEIIDEDKGKASDAYSKLTSKLQTDKKKIAKQVSSTNHQELKMSADVIHKAFEMKKLLKKKKSVMKWGESKYTDSFTKEELDIMSSDEEDEAIGDGSDHDSEKKDDNDEEEKKEVEVYKKRWFLNSRIWRVIRKMDDIRPKWRIAYDDDDVEYLWEYQDSFRIERHFGVNIKWSLLERLCKDDKTKLKCLHKQRIDFFTKVNVQAMIEACYDLVCNQWYPETEGIDKSKWKQYLKETNLVPKGLKDRLTKLEYAQLRDPFKMAANSLTKKGDLKKAQSVKKEPPKKPIKKKKGKKGEKSDKEEDDGELSVAGKNESESTGSAYVQENLMMIDGFKKLLKVVAKLLYPNISDKGDQGIKKLILDRLIINKYVSDVVWKKAKVLAMKAESLIQCASINFQSFVRKLKAKRAYERHIRASVIMETYGRRYLHVHRYKKKLKYLNEDRIVRVRYFCAVRVQSTFRMYYCRVKFLEYLKAKELAYKKKCEERRRRQKEKRKLKARAICLKQCTRLNGHLVIVSVLRKDNRRIAKGYDMIIKAYVPVSQETFEFDIPEHRIREYIESFLKRGGLSGNDIMERNNLYSVIGRLMCKVVANRPIVFFSRRSQSERGSQVLRRGVILSGRPFVMTVYQASDEYGFRAYDPNTSDIMRVGLPMTVLTKWLKDEERKKMYQRVVDNRRDATEARKILELARLNVPEAMEKEAEAKAILEKLKKGDHTVAEQNNLDNPPLLLPENQKALLWWMLGRISVEREFRGSLRWVLQMSYQVELHKQKLAAARIQGLYRQWMGKCRIRRRVARVFEKQLDRLSGRYFYVNKQTKEAFWKKTKLLGPEDLDDPPDEWRAAIDQNTDEKYYYNPSTGQTSWLNPHQAAILLQRCARRRQFREVGKPTFLAIARGRKYSLEARTRFNEHPERLTSVVNYALYLHTNKHDYDGAKKLLNECITRASDNPTVTRIYALFLLASCDPPRKMNYKRALDLLENAENIDPQYEKFRIAEDSYFHYALMQNYRDGEALMNWGLIQLGIHKNYDKAELFFRRAILSDPTNKRILQNYQDFEMYRYPGNYFESHGPSKTIVRRSQLYEEKLMDWGEWVKMKDMKSKSTAFTYYYYNSMTQAAYWKKPDFDAHLKRRLKRSKVTQDFGDWKCFKDPRLPVDEGGYEMFVNVKNGEKSLINPYE